MDKQKKVYIQSFNEYLSCLAYFLLNPSPIPTIIHEHCTYNDNKKIIENDLFSVAKENSSVNTILNISELDDWLSINSSKTKYELLSNLDPEYLNEAEKIFASELEVLSDFVEYSRLLKLHGHVQKDNYANIYARNTFNAIHKVNAEIHRLFGILRFEPNVFGTWIAFCSPDHDTTRFCIEYFRNRLGSDNFLIVDEQRKIARGRMQEKSITASILESAIQAEICSLKNLKTEDLSNNVDVLIKQENENIESLWKVFFNAHNNKDRKNEKAQRQHVPLRYRKYMNEFKKENCDD